MRLFEFLEWNIMYFLWLNWTIFIWLGWKTFAKYQVTYLYGCICVEEKRPVILFVCVTAEYATKVEIDYFSIVWDILWWSKTLWNLYIYIKNYKYLFNSQLTAWISMYKHRHIVRFNHRSYMISWRFRYINYVHHYIQ